MRHSSLGMVLACVASMVLAFLAPLPVNADLILPGATADDTGTLPPSAPFSTSDPIPAERAGYALTWDEFLGGAILLTLTVGGAVYLAYKANRHEFHED
jgi:hypothetical protein